MSTVAIAPPKTRWLNLSLWIAQVVLAAFYGLVGFMKVTQPIEALAAMMGWPGDLPEEFVRFVGTAELAGAIGLILPAALRIRPELTPMAAVGLVLLQICAMVFHVLRDDVQVLPINVVLLAISALIVWGRWRNPA